jgi:hypothetical protein
MKQSSYTIDPAFDKLAAGDRITFRSVRVATRNEVIKRNQESEFIQHRKNGVPAGRTISTLSSVPNVSRWRWSAMPMSRTGRLSACRARRKSK